MRRSLAGIRRWFLRVAAFGLVTVLTLTAGPRSVAWVTASDVAANEASRGTGRLAATAGSAESADPESGVSSAGVADTATILDWKMMAGLDYQTGEMTSVLQELDGQDVRIPGFIVPLEDFASNVSEFLIVPFVGACVHVPPPPPNQLVYVEMRDDDRVEVDWWNPVWVHGRLTITPMESVYGAVGFQLDGVRTEPFRD